MWSVLSEKPLRSVLVALYFAFVAVYLAIGFLPAEAEAEAGPVLGRIIIPAAGVNEDVIDSPLKGRDFAVPRDEVGAYEVGEHKVFLMGHSQTAFRDLAKVEVGDEIFYGGKRYHVVSYTEMAVEDVKMSEILAPAARDNLVLMTCAGENLGGDKYSRRLIVNAVAY